MKAYRRGAFFPGKSWLHRLDPRIKLLGMAILAAGIFHLSNLPLLCGLFLLLFPICLSAGLPLRMPILWMRPFLIFFVLIFLFHGLTQSSLEGWRKGGEAVMRFALLIGLATLIPATVQPTEAMKALAYFLRPLHRIGISSRDAGLMSALTLRFLPLLFEEGMKRNRAKRARGYTPKGKPISKRIAMAASHYSGLYRSLVRRADGWAKALGGKAYKSERMDSDF